MTHYSEGHNCDPTHAFLNAPQTHLKSCWNRYIVNYCSYCASDLRKPRLCFGGLSVWPLFAPVK